MSGIRDSLGAGGDSVAGRRLVPVTDSDPMDFSGRFNTALPPVEEQSYQNWIKAQSRATGRDMSRDAYDYDMRGFWKEYGGPDMKAGEHFTDTYKKPNHPTFSDQSQYHGKGGAIGGTWTTEGGVDYFTPGPTNLKNMSPRQLQEYFDKYGDGAKLRLR